MIESRYWKEELARISKSLRPSKKPPRMTKRIICSTERDLMIGFFIMRRLIELHKVSSKTANQKISAFSYDTIESVNWVSKFSLADNYNWSKETLLVKPAFYFANQFIHAYLSQLLRDSQRNWSDILIVSDFDRMDRIWRIPVSEIIRVFEIAATDWPSNIKAEFNVKKKDYLVTTN